MTDSRPLVALTLGDVAGIGPEVVARAWSEASLRTIARPFVVGHPASLEQGIAIVGGTIEVRVIDRPEDARPDSRTIPCLLGTDQALAGLPLGKVDARAGRAAHDFLVSAIDLALEGRVDAIVTLPLNKESLRAGGVRHPGHTEILAERCGVSDFAMMLYLGPPTGGGDAGLGVVHATLHVPLRDVFRLLTIDRVAETIALADRALRPLTGGRARGSPWPD